MNDCIGVSILDKPMEVDWGKWLLEHPDCDTVYEDVKIGEIIRVYAFSVSKSGNVELERIRNQRFSGKKIMKGLSSSAIAGLI